MEIRMAEGGSIPPALASVIPLPYLPYFPVLPPSPPPAQTPPLPLQPFIHRPLEKFYMKLMYWASAALYLPALYPPMNTKCWHCWRQDTEHDVFC